MSTAEIKPLGKAIAAGSHAEVFLSLADPTTTLAIWRRQLADELKDAAKLISEHAFEFITPLSPFCKEDRQRFRQELTSSTGCNCATLADDLVDLSELYAKVSQEQTVRIRIETVEDDGCRRFHLDNVVMRLVVTYFGPGTQWVPPAFATAAREQQTNYTGPLNCIDTGDVAIFRGKKSGAPDLVLHRSPPLRQVDPARLVAVIDSIDA